NRVAKRRGYAVRREPAGDCEDRAIGRPERVRERVLVPEGEHGSKVLGGEKRLGRGDELPVSASNLEGVAAVAEVRGNEQRNLLAAGRPQRARERAAGDAGAVSGRGGVDEPEAVEDAGLGLTGLADADEAVREGAERHAAGKLSEFAPFPGERRVCDDHSAFVAGCGKDDGTVVRASRRPEANRLLVDGGARHRAAGSKREHGQAVADVAR